MVEHIQYEKKDKDKKNHNKKKIEKKTHVYELVILCTHNCYKLNYSLAHMPKCSACIHTHTRTRTHKYIAIIGRMKCEILLFYIELIKHKPFIVCVCVCVSF